MKRWVKYVLAALGGAILTLLALVLGSSQLGKKTQRRAAELRDRAADLRTDAAVREERADRLEEEDSENRENHELREAEIESNIRNLEEERRRREAEAEAEIRRIREARDFDVFVFPDDEEAS